MMVPSQPKQTEYEKYKKDKDPVFDGKGKQLISKAGKLDDGLCPLSSEGICQPSRQGKYLFSCVSHWWKCCSVYKKNGEVT